MLRARGDLWWIFVPLGRTSHKIQYYCCNSPAAVVERSPCKPFGKNFKYIKKTLPDRLYRVKLLRRRRQNLFHRFVKPPTPPAHVYFVTKTKNIACILNIYVLCEKLSYHRVHKKIISYSAKIFYTFFTPLVALYLRLLNIKLVDFFETNLFGSSYLIFMIIKSIFHPKVFQI